MKRKKIPSSFYFVLSFLFLFFSCSPTFSFFCLVFNSFKSVVKSVLNNEYFGILDMEMSLVHVKDIAEAHIWAFKNEKAKGRYIVSNPKPIHLGFISGFFFGSRTFFRFFSSVYFLFHFLYVFFSQDIENIVFRFFLFFFLFFFLTFFFPGQMVDILSKIFPNYYFSRIPIPNWVLYAAMPFDSRFVCLFVLEKPKKNRKLTENNEK